MNKNESTKFQDTLTSILKRHITLGVESIFSTVYSGFTIETLSFTHILNRVMMLVQLPLTFVILNKNLSGEYIESFRTNHHKRHESAINKAKDESKPEHYFPLWQSDETTDQFYLLVLKADDSYTFHQLDIVAVFSNHMNSWEIGSYKLSEIFKKENYSHYPGFVKKIIAIIKNTETNLKSYTNQDNLLTNTHDNSLPDEVIKAIKTRFDTNLLSNMSDTNIYPGLEKRGVVDRVFGKIAKNISEINFEENTKERITNFLFFARDYHDYNHSNYLRHGSYNYSLRILLCDSQKDEIKSFFNRLRQEEIVRRKNYQIELKNVDNDKRKLATKIDDYFWKILKSGEQGEDDLLRIFGDYFGKNARSMADPVFDGLSFYRQPFARDGGMARCFSSDANTNNISDITQLEELDDLIRVVLCQYLFDDMVSQNKSKSKNLQLQIMLNPVEIGGRVWGVVAYATRSHNPSDVLDSIDDLKLYDLYWSKNYHIYRDVNERMKRNLRSYMNTFYEQFLGWIYNQWLRNHISYRIAYEKHYTLLDFEQILNQMFIGLACIFPYNVIECKFESKPNESLPVPTSKVQGGEHRALAGEGWAVELKILTESKFPTAPGVSTNGAIGFVDLTDVAVAMTDGLLRGATRLPDQQYGINK